MTDSNTRSRTLPLPAAFTTIFGATYLAVLVVFFAATLRRSLGQSAMATASFGGGVLLAVALTSGALGNFAVLTAARHHNTQAVTTLGYAAQSAWPLLSVAGAVFLLATGVAALRVKALPRWLAWVTIGLGVLALLGPAAFLFWLGAPLWFAAVGLTLERRSRRSARALGIAAALVVAAAGCGGSGGSASSGDPQTLKTTTSPPLLAGLIAIGHSGLTGENSDPNSPAQPAFENSWAPGSSPEVDSVYQRLVAAHPETKGRVANAAFRGAPVSSLAGQAQTALHSVPTPERVIVQTIDDDIRCDGTDVSNVSSFGDTLHQALTSINTASPESKILVVGQLGRPRPSFVSHLVADHPEVKHYLVGSGSATSMARTASSTSTASPH